MLLMFPNYFQQNFKPKEIEIQLKTVAFLAKLLNFQLDNIRFPTELDEL